MQEWGLLGRLGLERMAPVVDMVPVMAEVAADSFQACWVVLAARFSGIGLTTGWVAGTLTITTTSVR